MSQPPKANNSPVPNQPDAVELRRAALYLDGIKYSTWMAGIAFDRLKATLANIESTDVEAAKVSALLDTWTIVDITNRLRKTLLALNKVPGFSVKRRQSVKAFLALANTVKDFRNFVQHLDEKVPKLPDEWTPLWGALSWTSAADALFAFTLIPGNPQVKQFAPCIAYDRWEGCYANQIVLFHGHDLLAIETLMEKIAALEADLQIWVAKENPNITHAGPMRTILVRWPNIPEQLHDKRQGGHIKKTECSI
jgi:hypothetical protein